MEKYPMANSMNKEQAKQALKSGYGKSKALLNDKDKLDIFLRGLERKIEGIPMIGKELSIIPVMISLVKNFAEGKYTSVPYGTILAVTSALIYFASPIDFIPDFIPGVGYVDDMAVVSFCLSMVKKDIESYKEWRQSNDK